MPHPTDQPSRQPITSHPAAEQQPSDETLIDLDFDIFEMRDIISAEIGTDLRPRCPMISRDLAWTGD